MLLPFAFGGRALQPPLLNFEGKTMCPTAYLLFFLLVYSLAPTHNIRSDFVLSNRPSGRLVSSLASMFLRHGIRKRWLKCTFFCNIDLTQFSPMMERDATRRYVQT